LEQPISESEGKELAARYGVQPTRVLTAEERKAHKQAARVTLDHAIMVYLHVLQAAGDLTDVEIKNNELLHRVLES
jgi:hypothetical protein